MHIFSFLGKKKKSPPKIEYEDLVVENIPDETEGFGINYMDAASLEPDEKQEYVASLKDTVTSLEEKNAGIKAEYKAVSSYLSDIQLIDTMPTEEHDKLVKLAKHIQTLTVDRKIYQTTEGRISNSRYISMQHHEDEIKDVIVDMSNDEQRIQMISRDMKIIEAEKFGLRQDAKDLSHDQNLVGQITLISFLALISVFAVYILSSIFNPAGINDTAFLIIIFCVLLLVTAVFLISRKIKYNIKLTEAKLNRAISIHNKLKIKYVNAVSTLDYKKAKYDVDSAYELSRLYEMYLEAKKENEKYRRTTSEINEATEKLMTMLKNLNLYDPYIWQNEIRSLADKREMVEVRHRLNVRRQKLREQLEHNQKIIDETESMIKLYTLNYDLTND